MTERNPTVVVTSDETLPDVVARLREAANGGRTVDLVIPMIGLLKRKAERRLTDTALKDLKKRVEAD